MVTCICRLLLVWALVVVATFASFEVTSTSSVFRLLPRMPLKTESRFPLCLHHASYRAYKAYRHY
ncbi:hypothetical protein [Hymenobacter sp.]|uniref:hypothetical protein n=1 Tax=Hymenobacter sp. TaxID=1898978 RepID=UPI002EDAD2F1